MQKVTSKDGTQIAYDKRGQGPAVILVGGSFQHRAIDPGSARLAELLATDFTTYHYDRRGRGDSGNRLPYAKEREFDDLEALIEEAGGSAFLFGMSSGGILALDAAAAGLPISKLFLYEPPLVMDGIRPALPAGYLGHLRQLLVENKRGEAVEYFMIQGVSSPRDVVAQFRSYPLWSAFESVAHTLPYDAEFLEELMQGRPLPQDRWNSVVAPVLVVDGEDSPEWLRHGAPALAHTLRHGQHATLPGQTHNFNPEILAPMVAEFFKH